MSLNNIKNKQSERGFTIVELLIVIVVIGVLAAIVIVAYAGITNKSKSSKAQANAAQLQKVVEAFNADKGYYPALAASGTDSIGTYNGTTRAPSGVTIIPDNAGGTLVTASNGETTVGYSCLTTCSSSTGGRIAYWKFDGTAAVQYIYTGAAKTGDTFVAPAS